MLAGSPAQLNADQALDLWMAAAAGSAVESSLVYGWIMDAMRRLCMSHSDLGLDGDDAPPDTSALVLSDEVTRSLFQTFTTDDSFAEVCTLPAFNAITSMFLFLNEVDGRLVVLGGQAGLCACQFGESGNEVGTASMLHAVAKSLASDEGGVRTQSVATLARFSTLDTDLLGVDAVWQVALGASDEAASGNGSALLSGLQQYLAPPLAGEAQGMRYVMMAKCIKYLRRAAGSFEAAAPSSAPLSPQRSATSVGGEGSATRLMSRCVSMLHKLVTESVADSCKGASLAATTAAASALHPALLPKGDGVSVRLTIMDVPTHAVAPAATLSMLDATAVAGKADQEGDVPAIVPLSTKDVELTVYPNATALSLLAAVSFLPGAPIESLRLKVVWGGYLHEGAMGKTLAECGVVAGGSILVMKPRAPRADEEPVQLLAPADVKGAVVSSTAFVLTEDPECSEALLDVLDTLFASGAPEADLQGVWYLLRRLPVHSSITGDVAGMGSVGALAPWATAVFDQAAAWPVWAVQAGLRHLFTPTALRAAFAGAETLSKLLDCDSPTRAYLSLSGVTTLFTSAATAVQSTLATTLHRFSADECAAPRAPAPCTGHRGGCSGGGGGGLLRCRAGKASPDGCLGKSRDRPTVGTVE